MSESNNQETEPWLSATFKGIAYYAFCLVLALFAGTILLTCCTHYHCYHKRFDPPQMVLCVDTTCAKVDSVALIALRDSVNVLCQRQQDWYANYLSDLRQESNNNINKYNGWLSFWVALITILLTLVPLYVNYKTERQYKQKIDSALSKLRNDYEEELRASQQEVDKLKKEMDGLNSYFCQLHVQQSAIGIGSVHAQKIFADTSRRNCYWHSFLKDFNLNLRNFIDDYKHCHESNRYLEDDLKPLREVLLNCYYVLNLWSSSLKGKSQSKAIVTILGNIADLLSYTEPVPPEGWLVYYRNYAERSYSVIEKVMDYIKEKI